MSSKESKVKEMFFFSLLYFCCLLLFFVLLFFCNLLLIIVFFHYCIFIIYYCGFVNAFLLSVLISLLNFFIINYFIFIIYFCIFITGLLLFILFLFLLYVYYYYQILITGLSSFIIVFLFFFHIYGICCDFRLSLIVFDEKMKEGMKEGITVKREEREKRLNEHAKENEERKMTAICLSSRGIERNWKCPTRISRRQVNGF